MLFLRGASLAVGIFRTAIGKRGDITSMKKTKTEWLAFFQSHALSQNGSCISTEYLNSRTKLSFMCESGHTFDALPPNVSRGSWCPRCAGNAPLSLADMQAYAVGKGGECVSDQYVNENSYLDFVCANNHAFSATARSLRSQDCFCKECQKLTLEEFTELANSIDYKLITEKYINNYSHIDLLCSNGHSWRVQPKHFKEGRRCPYC